MKLKSSSALYVMQNKIDKIVISKKTYIKG
jgi:hypothetical protein